MRKIPPTEWLRLLLLLLQLASQIHLMTQHLRW